MSGHDEHAPTEPAAGESHESAAPAWRMSEDESLANEATDDAAFDDETGQAIKRASSRRRVIGWWLIGCGAVLVIGFVLVVSIINERIQNRDILMHVVGSIPLNASVVDAETKAAEFPSLLVGRIQQGSYTLLMIGTPKEIGSTNWIAHLFFENGRQRGRVIRILASERHRPYGAPDDLILPEFQAAWQARFPIYHLTSPPSSAQGTPTEAP